MEEADNAPRFISVLLAPLAYVLRQLAEVNKLFSPVSIYPNHETGIDERRSVRIHRSILYRRLGMLTEMCPDF